MCRIFSYIICSVCLVLLFCCVCSATEVSAKGAYALELESGNCVYEKNADIKMGMASTTKIMTGILVIENLPLDKEIKISSEAVGIEGSSIYLKEGETLTVENLLYALLLESANDAAVALSIATCGSVDSFVDMMNDKAQALGLKNTHFTNPHGLDNEEHYTTARDLALLAKYAMSNPIFSEVVSTYKEVIPLGNDGSRVLINHNKLLRTYSGTVGIKTGFTKKCGRCLVSCAEVEGVKIIAVTLNAPNDWEDHKMMLDLGLSQYENITLANVGDYNISLDTINGVKCSVLCSNLDSLSVTLKRDNINISASLEANRMVSAPIKQGDLLGKIVFKNNDVEIASLDLYAIESVKGIKYKKSIFERIFG